MRKAIMGCVVLVGLVAAAAQAAGWPAAGQAGSLEWAMAGSWRGDDAARDKARHPVEVLKFMGLEPNMTVVEIWPGGGYFTKILGPVLKAGGGHLVVVGSRPEPSAGFKTNFLDKTDLYGKLGYSYLDAKSPGLVPDGSADMVVTFRNVHNWMDEGFADKAFADFAKALKKGGILGVEEHRAKAEGAQDPKAANGYVQEAYVKALAAKAGFEFVKSSELLANPKDTKDHPFGVWTLPPSLWSTADGENNKQDPNFDHSKYIAIGESDRMLLVFRKK